MYRTAQEKIENWLKNEKKALLIYGARQVGKTYIIRETLKKNDISFLEINLFERPDILKMLQTTDDAKEISEKLQLYSNIDLKKGKSVIFLDEIQLYPDIVTKIKFLVDAGNFRYVLSGSNLGVEIKNIKSMPIGYVEMWKMYPFTFYEFALAIGISKDNLDYMNECYKNKKALDEIVHKKLLKAFYYYLIVGGMPAVIANFVENKDLVALDDLQKNIMNQYKADFTRYEAENRKLKIISVFDNIPAQLNKQDRRFKFTMLNKELKFDRYEESFLWLKDAGVAIPVYIASQPVVPLEMSKETNVFKLFQSDVGLLTSCYPLRIKQDLLNMDNENEINNGSLFENFVAQELLANEIMPYYYKTTKIGEIDFLAETDGKIIPIEVKSGKNYKKHTAINNLLKVDNYHLDRGIVLCTENIEISENVTYLPIYMCGCLKEEKPKSLKIDFEL